MRNRVAGLVLGLLAIVFWPGMAHAQSANQGKDAKAASNAPFDPHDLSGVWIGERDGRTAVDTKLKPPMTPWAQARFDAAVPTLGPRDIPGKENDPILHCDPDGVPKIIGVPQPFEVVQIPNRVFMFFEHDHLWRAIWADGRALPSDPDPSWMGYSVGKWDGDVFVVTSIGFNDVPWLDFFGDPHSDQMKLTERWKRDDHDTLEVAITIEDPKAYTKVWVNPPKHFHLHADWELFEHFCVPEEESAYAKHIRVPAGGEETTPAQKK